jgi:hypothetical protein
MVTMVMQVNSVTPWKNRYLEPEKLMIREQYCENRSL